MGKGIKSDSKIRTAIVFLTIILVVLMFPKGESIESEVTVGTIWMQNDLIASTTFEILKEPEVYEREKRLAAEGVHQIFILDNSIPQLVKDSIRAYNKLLRNVLDEDILLGNSQYGNTTILSPTAYQNFKSIRKRENNFSSRSTITLNRILDVSNNIIDRIYRKGLLNLSFSDISKDSISIREGKFEKVTSKTKYYDKNSASTYIDNYLFNYLSRDSVYNNSVAEYINHFLMPNVIHSSQLTNDAIELAKEKVLRNIGIVNENERIVAKHDRITKEIKDKIDSYRIAKGEESSFWARFAQNLGKFLHIISVFTLFCIYIYLFRKKIYYDNYKILLISIVILFITFLAFLIFHIDIDIVLPFEYLVLVPVASMLLTIIFDSRVGFYATVVIAFIIGGIRGNDYVLAITNIVAGGMAAYTVRDIKNRSQIFISFIYILIGYVVTITAFGLERFDSYSHILLQSGFAAGNALVSAVLTYGLIIFFERSFKITTDLTLLELTDFNNPLLKKLAADAPGTFTHSITMGSMVENAAVEIGANPILARVGAYYHDIGKTLEPDKFVENQLDNKNIHESLEPQKSADLIIAHVNQGIELAKKNKLPQAIIDFIPMHHGTMVVKYFYEKAKEKNPDNEVSEDDFRYPGPKPNTKETTLVMLADACESTVRSIVEPEVKQVENVISNLIKMRIDDNQLNDSPITLRDINKIKESFLKTLLVQHHKRIRYPKQEELENDPAES
ncbi:MAG: HDIG domain-containing protein [Ignavibacteria bacterium]|jgi:putative nucleotidyltransferase with HDIG domain